LSLLNKAHPSLSPKGNFLADKYKIGQNDYGALMDAAAKGKQVMAHRLYGHHLIYDFPLNSIM